MKIINTDVRGWKHEQGQYITGEGLVLSKKQVKEQCEYSAVPTTLVNIDERLGLDVALQVLRATSTGIERLLVTDDEKQVLSVLDPRSRFTPDDEFHSLIENIKNKGYEDVKIANTGGSIRATFETPANDTDSVLGDIFRRRVVVERMAQGGVYCTAALLRLACTNGMLVADAQYRDLFRKEVNEEKVISNFQAVSQLNTTEYFQKMFSNDGKWFEASVADYMGMRQTLINICGKEIADSYFPTAPIFEHYSSQNIQVDKIARPVQAKLPAGVTYFDTFNILTNGIKRAEDITLKEEIEVGRWARPSYLKQLREADIAFHGRPKFPEAVIQRLKGDAA